MICCRGCDYRVAEVSQRGIKVLVDAHCVFRVNQHFAGVIRFEDDGIAPVVGVVLRSSDKELVVKLTKGISLGRIMIEQRHIRKNYPMWLENK